MKLQLIPSILKFFSLLSTREKLGFFKVICYNIILSFFELFSLGIIYPLLSSILNPQELIDNKYINYFLTNISPFRGDDFIIFCMIIVSIVFVLKTILSIYILLVRNLFLKNLSNSFGVRIFKNYLSRIYEFHLQNNSTTLLRNVVNQIDIFHNYYVQQLGIILESVMVGIPLILFIFILEPLSFILMAITVALPSFIFFRIFQKKAILYGHHTKDAQAEKNKLVIEGFNTIKQTKVHFKEAFFYNRFKKASLVESRSLALNQSIGNSPRFFIEAISAITVIALMLFMKFNGYTSESIVTYMGVFAFAAFKLLPLSYALLSSLQNFAFGSTSFEQVYNDLKETRKVNINSKLFDRNIEENKDDYSFENEIELRNVQFKYSGSTMKVLKGVSFKIKKNQTIGLVGSTGSGKSTLVDIVMGFLPVTTGKLLVDGVDVSDKKVWTSKFGYVPQDLYLLDASIKENIAIGIEPEDIDNRRIEEVGKIAQLDQFIKTLPKKYDSQIGERGVQLSGGQKQRVSIARALYNKPDILILDEATSALDHVTEKTLVETLNRLYGEMTIIIIAHRLNTIRKCDQIYILEEGRITEQGVYQQLAKKSTTFKNLLKAAEQ